MSKKIQILISLALSIFFVSCKKGPIKPRKLDGTWNVTSISRDQTETDENATTTTTITFDGKKWEQVEIIDNGVSIDTSKTEKTYSSYSYEFSEDGSLTLSQVYSTQYETNLSTGRQEVTTGYTITQEGSWNMIDKYDESFQKNERFLIEFISDNTVMIKTTITYDNQGNQVGSPQIDTTSYEFTYSPGQLTNVLKATAFDQESMTTRQKLNFGTTYSPPNGNDNVDKSEGVEKMQFSKQ